MVKVEPQEQLYDSDSDSDIIEEPPTPEEITLDSESDEEVNPTPTSSKKPTATLQNVPAISTAVPGRSIPKPPILRTTETDVIDLTGDDETEANDNPLTDKDDERIEVDSAPPAEVGEEHKNMSNEHFKVGQYYQDLDKEGTFRPRHFEDFDIFMSILTKSNVLNPNPAPDLPYRPFRINTEF